MDRYLAVYLNDHLGLIVGDAALAARCGHNNRDSELEGFLRRYASEVGEDRRQLEQLMCQLHIRPDPVKKSAGWVAEKLGRLKLNGMLAGYSPLSRLEELEALLLAARARLALWESLRAARSEDPRLAGLDLQPSIDRARHQMAELERWRIEAAREAFGLAGARPPQPESESELPNGEEVYV